MTATMTFEVPLAQGVIGNDVYRAHHAIKRAALDVLDASPHRLVMSDRIASDRVARLVVATGDEANASTLLHEALRDLKVADLPAQTIHD